MDQKTILLLACVLLFSPIHTIKVSAKNNPEKESKTKIILSGDVQYRFRYGYETGKDALGDDLPAVGDYTNRYGWNFRVKARVSESIHLGMRLSNPKGYATDNIADNVSKVSKEPQRLVAIPEMYFAWNAGPLSLAGGIIPVPGNTVLDLAAFEGKGYKDAVSSWKNYTNSSQTGLNLGLSFIDKSSLLFGLDVLYAVARDNVDDGENTPSNALKNDQMRFIFTLPTSIIDDKLSFLPGLHMRTNMFRSADKEKANHSVAGGLSVGIKPLKQLGFDVGFAVGSYSNECMKNVAGYDTLKTAPLGLLTTIKVKIKPGYGKGIVVYKISNAKDREIDDEFMHTMMRWDVKYAFPVKGLTIMPRMRVWYSFNNSTTDKTEFVELRPELFLMSEF